MEWAIALLVKPFVLLGYMLFVRSCELLARLLPDGRIKAALLRRW